jgi:hypothetical protein
VAEPLLQLHAALLAVAGAQVVTFPAAFIAAVTGARGLQFAPEFGSHDAGGHSDDGEARKHDHRGHPYETQNAQTIPILSLNKWNTRIVTNTFIKLLLRDS